MTWDGSPIPSQDSRAAMKTFQKIEKGFDFFLVDRRVLELLVGIQENNAYLMGLILWLGFAPAVVSYDRGPRERRYGSSAWTFWRRVKHFVDSFVAFSYTPLRAASLTGFVVVVLAFVIGFPASAAAAGAPSTESKPCVTCH